MMIDLVVNIDGKLQRVNGVNLQDGQKTVTFTLPDVEEVLYPTQIVQLTAFVRRNYQRRTIVIHAVEENGSYRGALLHVDQGLVQGTLSLVNEFKTWQANE